MRGSMGGGRPQLHFVHGVEQHGDENVHARLARAVRAERRPEHRTLPVGSRMVDRRSSPSAPPLRVIPWRRAVPGADDSSGGPTAEEGAARRCRATRVDDAARRATLGHAHRRALGARPRQQLRLERRSRCSVIPRRHQPSPWGRRRRDDQRDEEPPPRPRSCVAASAAGVRVPRPVHVVSFDRRPCAIRAEIHRYTGRARPCQSSVAPRTRSGGRGPRSATACGSSARFRRRGERAAVATADGPPAGRRRPDRRRRSGDAGHGRGASRRGRGARGDL